MCSLVRVTPRTSVRFSAAVPCAMDMAGRALPAGRRRDRGMDETSVWIPLSALAAGSVSAVRCTWHGDKAYPCQEARVTGVLDRRGSRWSACASAAGAVAADRGVPLP